MFQIQSLESYQLDDLPTVDNVGLISCHGLKLWVKRVKHNNFWPNFKSKIGHSGKFVLHEIRSKMHVTTDHFFATVSDSLLDYRNRRSSHDQGAYSVSSGDFRLSRFGKSGGFLPS
jgi:hypothetical protein